MIFRSYWCLPLRLISPSLMANGKKKNAREALAILGSVRYLICFSFFVFGFRVAELEIRSWSLKTDVDRGGSD